MYYQCDERAKELGTYILQNKATVRQAAAVFKISKSTVHKDVTIAGVRQKKTPRHFRPSPSGKKHRIPCKSTVLDRAFFNGAEVSPPPRPSHYRENSINMFCRKVDIPRFMEYTFNVIVFL